MGIASGVSAGISLWPHKLYMVRPGSGSGGAYNDDDEWVPDPADVPFIVYNDRADVQDQGRSIQRTEEGLPSLRSEAVAFLRDESKLGLFQVDDTVTIVWEDGTDSDAVVIRISRLDGSLDLRRV